MEQFAERDFQVDGETTHYYEGGPSDGPLIIFLHGWPDIAEAWKLQLKAFAALGFRVAAPDMRGYGQSSAPKDPRAYRLERLVPEQLALLKHLGRDKAIWCAHDWGCGVLSAVAAHHQEVVAGLIFIGVAYRSIERGLDYLIDETVNRELYPKDKYPNGQWDYMRFYEAYPERTDQMLGPNTEKAYKVFYAKSDGKKWGQPAGSANMLNSGLFFGLDPDKMPDIPIEMTGLDESLLRNLVASQTKNGWGPATAYYLNHAENAKYDEERKNDGRVDVPVLYIDSKFDAICSASTAPKVKAGMRAACRDLTEASVEAGHWSHRQKPEEVNATIAKWLATSLPSLWPYAAKVPLERL